MSTRKYSWPKGVQNFHRIGHLQPFQSHERCLSHFIVLVGRRKVGTLLSLFRDDFSWLRNDQGPAVPGRRVKTPGESSCWKNYHCRKCCSMRSKNWSMDLSRLSFPEEKSRATARCDITPMLPISHHQRIYNLLTTSACVWQYAFIPCKPHSTPIPLSLAPPNGCVGDRSKCVLTHTFPASSCRAILSAVSRFEDHTDAPRPIFVSLARAITSSSVFQERMGTIGPVVTKLLLPKCNIHGGA
jgi:hypothetical protein